MNNELRQEIIEDLTAIGHEQGIVIDLANVNNWRLNDLKRIWVKGTQTRTGNDVLIKMRLRGSSLPAESFVADETRNYQVATLLNSHGVISQELISKQFEHEPEWLILRAIPGEKVGHHFYNPQYLKPTLLLAVCNLRDALDSLEPTEQLIKQLRRQDWCRGWLKEYEDRQKNVQKYLGPEAEKVCRELLQEELELKDSCGIVHTDLSPENILEQNGHYFFLDWGGAGYSTKALDWMMVWVFGVGNSEFQAAVIDEMLKRTKGGSENTETKKAALKVAARMIATFAEYCAYWEELPEKRISTDAEPHQTLKNLWIGLLDLQKKFNV